MDLRQHLEAEWVDQIRGALGLHVRELPVLWDADFFLGEREDEAAAVTSRRYVLCEINVSSVAPFPDSAIAPLVEAARRELALGAPTE